MAGAWDGFELAVRAVLGQQVSVAAGRGLAERLALRHGEPLPRPAGGLERLFPTPEALAAAEITGMPTARARALGILRRRGVHTIDVPAERLTVATIQRYLELKSRYL